MDLHPAPPAQLERIGRYRIVRPLSKGGMALVYEGRRESLAGVSPRVAIKLILPEHKDSRTFKDLFINEARLGASMQHQNLVGIQDFDCEEDTYYLVMEYVEGLTFRRLIGLCQQYRIGIPLGVIAELGRQACDGLHYAHSAKDDKGRHLRLVHRDIKPSNVILNPQGVVKVLDFGISKGRLRKEKSGSVKGTWGYMAPEQALGQEVWPSADVFGLGVVLYELSSLRPMFDGKAKEEIRRLLADDHAARMAATLDPHYAPLIGVLVRALQRDPRARFESANEFGRALSGLLPDPITARDEVVRFFETLDALDQGRSPTVGPATQPTGASIAQSFMAYPASDNGVRNRAGWFLTGAVSTALIALFTALAAVVAVLAWRDFMIGDLPSTRQDPQRVARMVEPAGPAGEGAPGEVRRDAGGPPPPPPEPVVEPEPPKPEPARAVVVRAPVVRPEPIPVPGGPGPDGLVPMPGAGLGLADPIPRAVTPSPMPDAVPVPTPVAKKGSVTVAAVQPAEVYIAGQFVAFAPVTQDLPAGRYAVSLVAMDGRRRTFEVDILPGGAVRRTWDFDRMEWR